MAARSGNAGAVVQAVKLKSQLNDLLVERVVTTHVDVAELANSLERLLGPAAAKTQVYERLMRRISIEPSVLKSAGEGSVSC